MAPNLNNFNLRRNYGAYRSAVKLDRIDGDIDQSLLLDATNDFSKDIKIDEAFLQPESSGPLNTMVFNVKEASKDVAISFNTDRVNITDAFLIDFENNRHVKFLIEKLKVESFFKIIFGKELAGKLFVTYY